MDASSLVGSADELYQVFETTLTCLEKLVRGDASAVFLLEGDTYHCAAARGEVQSAFVKNVPRAANDWRVQQIAMSSTPIVSDRLSEMTQWIDVSEVKAARQWLCAPLHAQGKLVGLVEIIGAAGQTFTPALCELVQAFADHTAIAVASASLLPELRRQARLDSLTRVLNHQALIGELREVCERYESSAIIMLDLDNFKEYNDNYGHIVGDQVLCATAQAIRAHIKQTDVVGRWGGDEFCVVLRGADESQATRVAERIRSTLAQTLIPVGRELRISAPTLSQGIAALPGLARDADRLIDLADSAMYYAKFRGRDQVIRAGELGSSIP